MSYEFGELASPRTRSREATDGPGGNGYVDRPTLLPGGSAHPSTAHASRGAAQPAAAFESLEFRADVLHLAAGQVDPGPLGGCMQVTAPPVSAASAATASSRDR